jgi:hypothetical protein
LRRGAGKLADIKEKIGKERYCVGQTAGWVRAEKSIDGGEKNSVRGHFGIVGISKV